MKRAFRNESRQSDRELSWLYFLSVKITSKWREHYTSSIAIILALVQQRHNFPFAFKGLPSTHFVLKEHLVYSRSANMNELLPEHLDRFAFWNAKDVWDWQRRNNSVDAGVCFMWIDPKKVLWKILKLSKLNPLSCQFGFYPLQCKT